MAEKLQTEPTDYISVVVNFRNLRFMTLIKENCLISDLIKEVENTFAKLCSVKVQIKTLKNSVNAVLPDWYPVTPLIRNQDEIYAFTDNAAEVLNVDLTKHGNCSTNSPLGSGIMPDSGFTSPIVKPGTSGEQDGPPEHTGIDVDGAESQAGQNKPNENLSQDEGNELLSEIFSLQDHNSNTPKQNDISRKKADENHRKNNTDNEKERDRTFEVEQGKLGAKKTCGKTQNTKTASLQETTNLPRMDENEPEEKLVKNSVDTQEEVNKSKEKTATSENESSSSSSDESNRESKKTSQQKQLSQNINNSLGSNGVDKKKKNKASKQTKLSESAQNKERDQKLIKRKNATERRMRLARRRSGLDEQKSEWTDNSTDNELMDIDKKHENKNKNLTLSLKKRTKASDEKSLSDENIDVDAANATKENSKSVGKDSSSRNEDMVVDEGGNGRNNKMEKTTTGVGPKELAGVLKGNTANDEQGNRHKIGKDTDKKTDNRKETKASQVNKTQSSGKLNKDYILASSSDNESIIAEGKTKEVKDSKLPSKTKDVTEEDSVKNESKGDTNNVDTKSGKTKKNQSSDNSSDYSHSSSDEETTSEKPTNDTEKPQERSIKKNDNVSKNAIKIKDITMTAKETASIKETSGGEKGEKNKIIKANSSSSVSSWSSSVDEDKEVKTTNNIKTLKSKNGTGPDKDNSQTDVVDGDKSKGKSSKNEKQTTTARKSNGEVKDNTTKLKTKRKDTVSSPAKSVRESKKDKKNKENKTTIVSPAKSVARSKKNVASKTKADLTKIDKGTETEEDTKSESSVSTLKAPFTQLPAKDKGPSESSDSSEEEDVVKNKEILKDGKKKRKHDSTDKKTAHATTTAEQEKPNDPNTPLLCPQTPSRSTSRKSAVMLSASKVASWLLSNPVSENVAGTGSNETKSPQKAKTRSKHKTKDNVANVDEVTNSETALKPKTNSKNKTKENITNSESIVDKIDSDKTLLSPKGETRSQKRKLDEVNEQEQSTKTKKNKKKKSEGKKEKFVEETQDKQDKPVKSSVKTKKGKNTLLSLPKNSKGLLALLEDESDYNTKSTKKSKKQKLTPPTVNRRLKHAGFMTPSRNVERKSGGSKTPKSRIKKILPSQPSKTVEMNTKEQEFLDSGAVNLETLLNNESIEWYST